jgi:hypothetical protein
MQSRIGRIRFAAWLQTTFDLDEATAGRYANFMGDQREFDEEGNLVVRDFQNAIIARLPSNRFGRTAGASPV